MKKLILPFMLVVACRPPWSPNMDPLSSEWAVFVHNHPGGRLVSNQADKEKAMKEALDLARGPNPWSGPSQDAPSDRARIEKAIALYADGGIYFAYGEALVNEGQYTEAIQAYQIALTLDVKKPEMALYGIAVCHGYLGNAEDAVGYLPYRKLPTLQLAAGASARNKNTGNW